MTNIQLEDARLTEFYKIHFDLLAAEIGEKDACETYEMMIAEGVVAGYLDNGLEMSDHCLIMKRSPYVSDMMTGLMFKYMLLKGDSVMDTILHIIDKREHSEYMTTYISKYYADVSYEILKERRAR